MVTAFGPQQDKLISAARIFGMRGVAWDAEVLDDGAVRFMFRKLWQSVQFESVIYLELKSSDADGITP